MVEPIYAATDVESDADGACTDSKLRLVPRRPRRRRLHDWRRATDGPAFGLLSFKNAPDFENPADADMDNVYEITVKVTDSGVADKNKMSATRDVMIIVTNDNEPGEVTFSSVQPKVVRPFTATLNDPDGMTTGVKWEWMEDNVR